MPGREWTKTELTYLRNHCEYESDLEIAKALRRTVFSVRGKRRRILERQFFRWDEEKDAFLREHYATMFNSEIARHLGCSKGCVYVRAHKLGISKPDGFNDYMAGERGKLIRRAYEINGTPNAGQFKPGEQNGTPYRKGRTVPKEETEKRLKTMKELRHRERIRVAAGLKQLTKLRL